MDEPEYDALQRMVPEAVLNAKIAEQLNIDVSVVENNWNSIVDSVDQSALHVALMDYYTDNLMPAPQIVELAAHELR
jgi:hypothetical protein